MRVHLRADIARFCFLFNVRKTLLCLGFIMYLSLMNIKPTRFFDAISPYCCVDHSFAPHDSTTSSIPIPTTTTYEAPSPGPRSPHLVEGLQLPLLSKMAIITILSPTTVSRHTIPDGDPVQQQRHSCAAEAELSCRLCNLSKTHDECSAAISHRSLHNGW